MSELSFNDVLSRRRSQREFNEDAIDLDGLNRLIWAAQGRTSENGGRTVSSAHALHPLRLFTEGWSHCHYLTESKYSPLE
ncbi:MAG: hypothetical protein ACI82O_000672 [Patiriisocius sp.]|jgi:hypothetical protein